MSPELLQFLSTITPGGVGIWTGVLMLAGWFAKEWRETRKMTVGDRQAKREGFAKQVELLQSENRSLRADLSAAETKHDEYRHACQAETDSLRRQVRGLEDEVMGFKRRLDTQATVIGRAVLGVNAPTSAEKFGGGE